MTSAYQADRNRLPSTVSLTTSSTRPIHTGALRRLRGFVALSRLAPCRCVMHHVMRLQITGRATLLQKREETVFNCSFCGQAMLLATRQQRRRKKHISRATLAGLHVPTSLSTTTCTSSRTMRLVEATALASAQRCEIACSHLATSAKLT